MLLANTLGGPCVREQHGCLVCAGSVNFDTELACFLPLQTCRSLLEVLGKRYKCYK